MQPHSLSFILCFSLSAQDKGQHPASSLCHLLTTGRARASRPVVPEPLARQNAGARGLEWGWHPGDSRSAVAPWSQDLAWPADHPRQGEEYRLLPQPSPAQTNTTHVVYAALQPKEPSCSALTPIFHLAASERRWHCTRSPLAAHQVPRGEGIFPCIFKVMLITLYTVANIHRGQCVPFN